MNITLPDNFHPQSRVWIYQSDKAFDEYQSREIKQMLENFLHSWKSHGEKVKGYANVFFDRFIVLMADESSVSVGGCSTDSSVRVIKEIEIKLNLNFFNRELLTFFVHDELIQIPLNKFENALDNHSIFPESLYFDNTILTKQEFETNWIIPLKNSWLKKYLTPKIL